MPATRAFPFSHVRRPLRQLLAFVVLAGAGSTALLAASAQASSPCSTVAAVTTCTYSMTGEQQVTIPAGVSAINVDAIGGAGGTGGYLNGLSGGLGAQVTATLPLAGPGPTMLYVEVGGDGANNTSDGSDSDVPGGFDGGGASQAEDPVGALGAGGGGASDVRTELIGSGLSPDPRLIVAGGGGGGSETPGGSGDAGVNPGDGGPGSGYCADVGEGGTATQGGAAGADATTANDGSLGEGGPGFAGGGGGGGYYGGGGGSFCGGGGGGSSYVSPTATAHQFLAATTAAPSVTISYTLAGPPTVTITTPPNNASYTYGQVVDANYGCSPATNATLKSCTGTVPDGKPINTSTVASGQSFAVTATDTDSQATTVTHTYTVTAAPTNLTAAPQLDLRAPRSAVGLDLAGATLTSGGAVLSGQKITFADGALQLCTAITHANGIATCPIPLKDEIWVLLNNHYTATYTATTDYTGATTTTPAVIL
jgi:hypothetical protein